MATHPTRRQVLGGGSALALGALPAARLVPRDDPDVLRVGLVGCGGRGSGAALNTLRAEDGTVVLTALADVFPERTAATLANLEQALGEAASARLQVDPDHHFHGFDAYQRLIDSDVDVVVLGTPPHFRPEHLAACVAAGKHVFCEKPVAVDGPGLRSVLASAAEARRRGLGLASGFCWRSNIRHRAFYTEVHAGRLGDLRAVYSTYNATPNRRFPREQGWSDLEWQLRNWFHFTWLSGDHVVEQAVHSLDKMAWTFGDRPPLSCTAVGGRQAREGAESGNVYDHFSATFDYGDGVKGFHMCRQMPNCDNDNSDFVLGSKGHGIIQGWTPLHAIEGEDPWFYEGPGNDMYQTEHDELFASIRAGTPKNEGEWMSHSTLLAIMVRLSAYSGRTVTWDQALDSSQRLGPEDYAFGPLAMDPVPVPGQWSFS